MCSMNTSSAQKKVLQTDGRSSTLSHACQKFISNNRVVCIYVSMCALCVCVCEHACVPVCVCGEVGLGGGYLAPYAPGSVQ